METRMLAAVARGRGLVTALTLRSLGIDPRQVAKWVRCGRLVSVRRGVYTTSELWSEWDEFRERPLARVRAVQLTMRDRHPFSHDSGALVHKLPLLAPQDSDVHVTVPHLRATETSGGVRRHGARFADSRCVTVDGLRVLDVPRTVVDLAREHGYRRGLVAADGAMQRGVTRGEMWAAAREMTGWPFSRTVAAVVEDADPGAESALETLARELVVEAGLMPVETQFPVRTSSGVVWVDLRVGRHLIEADGRAKSRPVADGGLADRDLERVLWDERRRQREVCAEQFGMTRLTYADHWGAARTRAVERLLAEYAVTEQRFGTELTSDQAEFAARMRGRRNKVAG
jgi:hypothetical protein